MVMSLRRKMALRRQAADAAAVRSTVAGLSRAGQVSRSTVPVEDADIPVVETLEQAVDTAETLPGVIEAADQAGSDAYDASMNVGVALAEALQAAQDAADALTSANGKNSRRRGVTEPDPPDGGWVQGDQWVRDEDRDGVLVPVQVLVWDGSAFVPEQIIADDILVLGVDGTVRIADNTVSAGAMMADFYFGREFHGGLFEGGLFRVSTGETLAGFVNVAGSASAFNGLWDLAVGERGWDASEAAGYLQGTGTGSAAITSKATFPAYQYGAVVEVTFQVKATQLVPGGGLPLVTVSVFGGTSSGLKYSPVEGEWLEVSAQVPVAGGVAVGGIGIAVGQLSASGTKRFLIKDLAVRIVSFEGESLTVGRDPNGMPEIRFGGVNGPSAITTGGATFRMPLTAPGNTFALKSQLDAWAPIDGTHAWVTSEGREYVRAGGVWRALADVAKDTDWANVTVAGATGTCQWRRLAGIIYLQFDVTFTTAVAANGVKDPMATLPAAACPVGATAISMNAQGSNSSSGFVNASGGITFRNLHTAALTRFTGTGQWPAAS